MKSLVFIDYLIFGAYFFIVFGIALWVSRKPKDHQRNSEDYFLAGRSLPWWIIGASLIASNISTEQIIGMNGTAFESGIAVISYSLIGASMAILLVAKFFLPRFLSTKIYSMPEFLERRYDKRVSTTMGMFWILVYIFVNLTSVLSLGAITLNAVLGIPIIYSVVALATISAIYTIYGGLKAVAWTDFVQVSVLILGGLTVVWLGLAEIASIHGEDGIFQGFDFLINTQKDKFHTVLPLDHEELPWTGVFFGGLWIAALSYWGCNQYIIQRALAASNVQQAQLGLLFAAFLSVVVAIIIVLPGVIASDLYPHMITSRDEAFPVLIRELLPVGYSGLVIAALIAAIISSLNSMCNSVATIFTMDVYRYSFHRNANEAQLVKVGRWVTAIALLLAVIVTPTIASMGKLFAFIQEYTGFVSPGVLCIFLLGFFWKRMTSKAALWAVLLTIPISALLKVLFPDIAFLDRMMITFLNLLLVSVVISLSDNRVKEVTYKNQNAGQRTTIVFNIGAIILVSLISIFYIVFW